MFVYTAYLDESGTHDGSPLTVMGGVLGRAEQWRDFDKKFAAVQSQYGFRVWHLKSSKRRPGISAAGAMKNVRRFIGQ